MDRSKNKIVDFVSNFLLVLDVSEFLSISCRRFETMMLELGGKYAGRKSLISSKKYFDSTASKSILHDRKKCPSAISISFFLVLQFYQRKISLISGFFWMQLTNLKPLQYQNHQLNFYGVFFQWYYL